MGIAGACRRNELAQLTLDDIEDVGSALIVKINKTKNKINRTFTVVNNEELALNFLQIFRKYVFLRPSHTEHRRLFVYYKNGKCTSQVVGKNTLGQVPQRVAKFLNMPDAGAYTGHCFRRSSATLLADGGADLISIKRHGGWKSSAVAETYIEDSLQNKMKIAQKVMVGEGLHVPSTSNAVSNENVRNPSVINTILSTLENDGINESVISESLINTIPSAFNISNCNNCKIDINVHINK